MTASADGLPRVSEWWPASAVAGALPGAIAVAWLTMAPATLASAQDAEAGAAVFNKCRACHQVGATAKNTIGPHLNGLVGRKSASVDGYNYSAASKKADITWDEENVAAYIRNPRGFMPGTKMAFAGLTKDSEVENLLTFLKQFKPDGSKS